MLVDTLGKKKKTRLFYRNKKQNKKNRDKVRKRFFKRSARNWHLKTVNLLLKDDICLYTTSRNNKFELSFPHEWKKLHGALVRQSDANEISFISKCTNI